MATTKKVKPLKPVTGRVCNYRAPVDTAGMDPEMKRTMGVGQAKKVSPFNLRALLKARKSGK